MVRAFGGEAVLTSPQHATGTDRLAEAALRARRRDRDQRTGRRADARPAGHRRRRRGARERPRARDRDALAAARLDGRDARAFGREGGDRTTRGERALLLAQPHPPRAPGRERRRPGRGRGRGGGGARAQARRALRLPAGGAPALRRASPAPARAGRGPRAAAGTRGRHADPRRTARRRGGRGRRHTGGPRARARAACSRRREREFDQVHLRDGRGGLLARQGPRLRLDRGAARGARLPGRDDEVRPVHQRRSRHHEPLPARRGLRHGGRRRDRPRPRALRALHALRHLEGLEHHHRQGLRQRDRARAARRLPRPHGAGDPAHHRRDQVLDPPGGERRPGTRGRRRGDRRDRRHGRRHRGPALPRGGAPVPPGRGARERDLRPPGARALHRDRPRAQDQADAAQRARAARDRHLAERAAVPHRPLPVPGPEGQARALLRRARGGGDHRQGRGDDLRGAARALLRGARRHHPEAARPHERRLRHDARGRTWCGGSRTRRARSRSGSSAST